MKEEMKIKSILEETELTYRMVSNSIQHNFSYFKHMTTLCTGSILILLALLDRVLKNPKGTIFLLGAFLSFMVALLFSLWMMRLMNIMLATPLREDIEKATDEIKKTVETATKISKWSNTGFAIGIIFVLCFFFTNFIDISKIINLDGIEENTPMISSGTLSAISIFIALVGVSLYAIFTKPYPGAAPWAGDTKESLYKLRRRIGYVANILIVIGTAGQLVSLLI